MNKSLKEIDILIRARYPIIYILSWEEVRVQKALQDELSSRKKLYTWTSTEGLKSIDEDPRHIDLDTANPLEVLEKILQSDEAAIYILKDFHHFITSTQIIRKLRDLIYNLVKSYKNIIIISPLLKIPMELEKDITVVDYQLPDLKDLNKVLENIIETVKNRIKIDMIDGVKEKLLKAALGLTLMEADNVFSKAIVTNSALDKNSIKLIMDEKSQIIRKSGYLEFYETSEKLSDIGGLENLKEWLIKREKDFSEAAREFGLPVPRGLLLLGPPGCGKSITCKASASLWQQPLLKFDIGNVFGKYVGESEEGMRRAIKTAESVAPCILWIDEIEKGFAGVSGGGDSGTTARVFGNFLTWMQEKKKPVFVIATANNIKALPPEMLRKGRFDEIFFLDLPDINERKDILKIHIEKRGRTSQKFDLGKLAKESKGFISAELEEVIISGLRDAFNDGQRDVTTEDMLRNIKKTVPLSITMKEDIEELREWAKYRSCKASKTDIVETIPDFGGRKLEL